jgi:ankyrin repeat protein
MRNRNMFLALLLAAALGCKPSPSSENSPPVVADPRIESLQQYADKRMQRLMTPTGQGVIRIEWDLSQDNRISAVDWPKDERSDEYILNQDIDLSLKLPGDFQVEERATLLICDREDPSSDRLHSISFQSPQCTTDQAFETAKRYIVRWQLQKEHSTQGALVALDRWCADAKKGSRQSYLAVRNKNYPMIDIEIHRTFNERHPWFLSFYFGTDKAPLHSETVACFEAIRVGDSKTARALIEAGLDPNSRDTMENSLLHAAAEANRMEVARLLIGKGAIVDSKGSYQQTPLWEAVFEGHFEMGELLLREGADINSGASGRGTVLHYVCEYLTDPVPNSELAQWLIDHGAQVNVIDRKGDTPLHKSAWKGHVEAARVFIAAGADVNAINEKGCTPLDHALNQKQLEIEKLLREKGAQKGQRSIESVN